MKIRDLKKLFAIFTLLFTFHFLLFARSSFASHLSSLKSGFIEEADSGDDQAKKNQGDRTNKKYDVYDKSGKFSLGVDVGLSSLLIHSCYIDENSFSFGANGGYWINNRIRAGLAFLYHLNHKNIDYYDGGPDISLISVLPQIKYSLVDENFTPTIGFGFGPVVRTESGWDYTNYYTTYLVNVNGGLDYFFKHYQKIYSAGIYLTYNIAPGWKDNLTCTSEYLTIGFEFNHLF